MRFLIGLLILPVTVLILSGSLALFAIYPIAGIAVLALALSIPVALAYSDGALGNEYYSSKVAARSIARRRKEAVNEPQI